MRVVPVSTVRHRLVPTPASYPGHDRRRCAHLLADRASGLLFHTDQGGEYTGELFAQACRHAGVTQSMGRTGSALDNAAAESFNSTVEFELLRSNHFATREQARRAVAGWIDEYNTVRRHSTDQMLSPVDYEHRQAQIGRVAA